MRRLVRLAVSLIKKFSKVELVRCLFQYDRKISKVGSLMMILV